jgi:hypothetical protein
MRRILEKMLLRRDAAAFRGSGDADDPMVLFHIYIYMCKCISLRLYVCGYYVYYRFTISAGMKPRSLLLLSL